MFRVAYLLKHINNHGIIKGKNKIIVLQFYSWNYALNGQLTNPPTQFVVQNHA